MRAWFHLQALCAVLAATRAVWAVPVIPSPCVATVNNGPLQITAECVDPVYQSIVVDSETDETLPVIHHKIAGHFVNTTTKVNLYLPPKKHWKRRFFHYVYPTQSENAVDGDIAFSISSGAYWVQITGGVGYRADAAAAKISRGLVAKYYGDSTSRIYGYLFGGSGGSYQTMGAIENSVGVWDGAAPFIQGVPESNPPNFCAKALAGFVLASKKSQIIESVSPGGSGNPLRGLSVVEQAAFTEATLMGVPVRSWEDFDRVGGTRSMVLLNTTYRALDSSYKNDFWTLPGYVGTEPSALGDLFRAALVNYTTTVTAVRPAEGGQPASFELADVAAINITTGLDFTVYDPAGNAVGIVWGALDLASKTVRLFDASAAAAVAAIQAGSSIKIDNKLFLALHTYHRHQIPKRSGFQGFDQFLNASGVPRYPQRPLVLAELFARGAGGGGTQTGNISVPIIAVNNLLDSDAFPYQADWYRQQVQQALGVGFADKFRIWYNDHANHDYDDPPVGMLRSQLIPFRGILQYALLELVDWVERGSLPAQSTGYTVSKSQVVVDTARNRRGVQPVASLTVNGAVKASVSRRQSVTLRVQASSAVGEGKIVAVEWDWEGTGNFVAEKLGSARASVDIKAKHVYATAGRYYPAVRVTVQRDSNPSSAFARVMNLGRARVDVR